MTKKEEAVVEEKDIFEDDNAIPESNWFKFEKAGDSVSGELLEFFDKESNFGPQRIYVIKTKDGEEINVGLKHSSHKFNIAQLKKAEIGDTIGIKFREFIDTGKGNPAKAMDVRVRPRQHGEF